MIQKDSASHSQSQSSARWFHQVLGRAKLGVRTRQQGNTLHVLLVGSTCPHAQVVARSLIKALR
ncbi:MAG: hypothetical protein AAGF24_12485, partial [Cyanobacteria bacterium P01_H01_bin.121]